MRQFPLLVTLVSTLLGDLLPANVSSKLLKNLMHNTGPQLLHLLLICQPGVSTAESIVEHCGFLANKMKMPVTTFK